MGSIAVIGGGISGLGAAYELAKAGVKVVLYEKESYLGGHAKTLNVDGINLDLGFMIFNRASVYGYKGVKMPGWLTLLPNIIRLDLDGCWRLGYLPCLGSLRYLKPIHLLDLKKLEYIGVDDPSWAISCRSDKEHSFFPSLEEVRFEDLPNKVERMEERPGGRQQQHWKQAPNTAVTSMPFSIAAIVYIQMPGVDMSSFRQQITDKRTGLLFTTSPTLIFGASFSLFLILLN